MNRLEKIDMEEQRAREKIAAMQAILKEIGDKRTEQENLQIIQQIRALKLSREELYGFLDGGGLPAALAGMTAQEPEAINSRRAKRARTTDAGTADETAQGFDNAYVETARTATDYEREEDFNEED